MLPPQLVSPWSGCGPTTHSSHRVAWRGESVEGRPDIFPVNGGTRFREAFRCWPRRSPLRAVEVTLMGISPRLPTCRTCVTQVLKDIVANKELATNPKGTFHLSSSSYTRALYRTS